MLPVTMHIVGGRIRPLEGPKLQYGIVQNVRITIRSSGHLNFENIKHSPMIRPLDKTKGNSRTRISFMLFEIALSILTQMQPKELQHCQQIKIKCY